MWLKVKGKHLVNLDHVMEIKATLAHGKTRRFFLMVRRWSSPSMKYPKKLQVVALGVCRGGDAGDLPFALPAAVLRQDKSAPRREGRAGSHRSEVDRVSVDGMERAAMLRGARMNVRTPKPLRGEDLGRPRFLLGVRPL
jgi:hypothetical protein